MAAGNKQKILSQREILNMVDESDESCDDTEEMTGGEEPVYGEEVEGSDSDGDAALDRGGEEEQVDAEQNIATPPKKHLRLKDRDVHSLDTALDESNYDPYTAPVEKKVVKVITQKKTKNDAEESVLWYNQEVRSRAGRDPAVQIRRVQEGVVPKASSAVTPGDCFSLFLSGEADQ